MMCKLTRLRAWFSRKPPPGSPDLSQVKEARKELRQSLARLSETFADPNTTELSQDMVDRLGGMLRDDS